MKFNARHLLLIVVLLWQAGYIHGQTVSLPGATTPTVKLGWTAPSGCISTSPCSYIPYRISGSCPTTLVGSPGWTALPQTATQVGSTVDSTVAPGTTYSYVVETVQGVAQSGPSNCVTVSVPNVPSPATGLTAQ